MGLFDGIAAEPGRSGAAADLARRYGIAGAAGARRLRAVADGGGDRARLRGARPGGADRRGGAEPGGERAARGAAAAGRSRRSGCRWWARCARNPEMALPERHLGLVQAREHAALEAFVERLADVMEALARSRRDPRAGRRRSRIAGRRRRGHGAAAAGPADRDRGGCGLQLRLSAPGAAVAGGGGRARSLLAAGRRGAGPVVRRLLAAGRLSGAACRAAGGGGAVPRRAAAVRRDPAGAWRVRRVHGARPGARGRRGRHACDDRAARACDELRAAADEPRVSPGGAVADAPIGRAGQIVRGHEFHYPRLIEPGDDAPLAALFDGQGNALGPSGGAARAGERAPSSTRSRSTDGAMRELLVIGIGTGQPGACDDRGGAGAEPRRPRPDPAQGGGEGRPGGASPRDLRALPGESGDADRRVRHAGARCGGGYREGVDAWHREIAGRLPRLLLRAPRRAWWRCWSGAIPSLYDSTLRILDLLAATAASPSSGRVIPGITSLQVLAARHRVPLNSVGGPVHVTTGRRLREAVPGCRLDRGAARRRTARSRRSIRRGSRSTGGRISGCRTRSSLPGRWRRSAERIVAARAEARAANGWIMDAYLLRRE